MIRLAHKAIFVIIVLFIGLTFSASGQEPQHYQVTPSGIRIGERLTYNMSFQRYNSVGFAELYAVSRGKLGDADAVEIRMRFKTTGLLSAAFYEIDETATVLTSPETGLPLRVRRLDNVGVSSRETVTNYLTSPAPGYDLLSLIYKVRQSGGSGSFNLSENDKTYSVTFQPQGTEHLRSDAGEFETSISIVQSEFLTERGIQLMKINFSTDEAHVPVQVRFKTAKGEFRIVLSGIQMVQPEVEATPTPSPVPVPKPVITPRPTPAPYIENLPLSSELGFALGEKLTFKVSSAGRTLGNVVFQAKERKQINGDDSLILSAVVASAEPGNGLFATGDAVVVRANPETLTPYESTTRMSGSLAGLNQVLRFDQKGATVNVGPNKIDSPVGTHSLLTLFYAARSFNLTPSKDLRNPINDTRVAVFWQDKAYIFMLRPFEPEMVAVNGQKVLAQKVTVKTNIPQLDLLGISMWLTPDTRVPVLISVGPYQAELIAKSETPLK